MEKEMEKTKATEAGQDPASSVSDGGSEAPFLTVKLADPFYFEGQAVAEIPLNGLFDLTAADLCAIDLQMMARGYAGARMEVTKQYALLTAARVNGKPWEWLDKMKARDCLRLRETITAFFFARG